MIIATAGHVDHGKTTLVKALTGVDTDRLPEEQARGMTIDLGFAQADLAPGLRVGFIDVPGHERLVRNMLAGVAAIDLALLVVAADDGPMPQTREHLDILALLGVPQLVVALTKADRVDAARLAAARAEVAALLQAGPHAGAPVLDVVAPTGQGVAALREHLAGAARAVATRPADGHFRLTIDRSFAVDGAGRVVTGAVLAGQVQVGDAVQLLPQGTALRVRGLQVLGKAVQSARAGQRCAVNLAGADLKRAAPARGDWLAASNAPPPSSQLDVQLQWLPAAGPPPVPRAQLLLHIGAAAVPARWSPLGDVAPQAGGSGWARLTLAQPVSAAWGDRFILREAAAHRSLAGGWVVDAFGPSRGRSQPQRLAQLAALALADPAAALSALAGQSPDGVDLDHFRQARSLPAAQADALHRLLSLHCVPRPRGLLGLTAAQWQHWQQRLLQAVDAWHAARPDSLGPDEQALRQALDTDAALLRASVGATLASGALVRDGLCIRRPDHQPVLPTDEADLLQRVAAQLQPAGLRPPIVGDLAQQLDLTLPVLLDGLARLTARGLLVRVAPNRWYLPQTVQQLAAVARELAAASPDGAYDAAAYRDRSGIGRNLTVQVIEFLDRAGITRFDGSRHHLRG
ncbi:selenocysteine-specific translation elongation factor [Pseudaquabacterium pictum]|uniref:Selenocysteine-specific elongation factor n=1 Tax=Pseudaquabacterium pictum TaxID=2315236 RepID=A0A480ARR3_9BURK|nr:selenocysteine-specific translation elongation factor [Rubrivivax pictus]GCL61438.1 selenocysteine-specific translation factor [Rubrivivax pictus]